MTKKYIVSSASWEYLVEGSSSDDVATKAFEKAYSEFGQSLDVSSVIKVLCFSDLEQDVETEQYIDFCYTPEIMSNAGFHDSATSFNNIIENEN
jgi:hypothetical protein|tara:strand:+ start:457 stop:738 length:282 start_codon:yes stop_codon:yes gene_type:complete